VREGRSRHSLRSVLDLRGRGNTIPDLTSLEFLVCAQTYLRHPFFMQEMSFPRTYTDSRVRPQWVNDFNKRAPYSFVTGTPMIIRTRKRANPYAGRNQYARTGGVTYATAAKRRRVVQVSMPTRPALVSVARTRGAAVQGEMKYFDTYVDNSAISVNDTWATTMRDPATINCLFAPSVGAAYFQRIGKACKIMKLKIHGCIHFPPEADENLPPYAMQARVLLVQDKQTNSAQMTGEQLMQGSSGLGALVAIQDFQNTDNFGRFRVWKDKRFVFENDSFDNNGIAVAGRMRTFKFNLDFPDGLEIRFNQDTSGTVASIVDHSFHIVVLASNNVHDPRITYRCRVCFKD